MDFKNTKNVLPYYIYFFVTIQQMEYWAHSENPFN